MSSRYAFVRQDDQSDCGAAALAMLALHYRRPLGLQQVRELAGTDRIGTNLLGLQRAAEKLGFAARGVKGPFEALANAPLPAIAHVRTTEGLGHFVVLYETKNEHVTLADPARGIETLSREDFCRLWTGYLLLATPDAARAATVPTNAPISPVRRFLRLLGTQKAVLLEAAFCALLMTVLGLSTSYFVQHLVDSVLVREERRLLNALGVGMVLVVVFRTLFSLLRQYLLAHVSRKVDLALVAGYARHVLGLPLRFFEMRRIGEILSRVQDAAKVREAISSTATTAVVDGVLVLLLVVVLWIYDVPLALVATGFIPLLLLGVALHHPAVKRRSREAMEKAAHVSAHLVEDVSAVETVKAFGAERGRSDESEARLTSFVQAMFSMQKLGLSMDALGLFLTALAGIVILWYGGHRVMSGMLSVGQLLFFYTLLGYMLEPLNRLAGVNLKIQDALVAVDRLYQILDLEREGDGSERKVKFTGLRDAIVLQDVGFRYGCRDNVLEGINLRLPAGQTVAIVGESGSGKSTLLKLLMGFYAPTTGRLLFDGVDGRDLEAASLRSRIGLVSQEPFIFNGTIAENIALGRPEAPLAEVMAAVRAAGLEAFINGLPQRYETIIGERGANLSGGQRQRLAIARALLRRPDVLIFDEATSHLDTATERAIQHSLRGELAGKTVVLVAHRLSTVKDADRIYVLHQGRVVEEGSHRQLMARGGRYADLWRAQVEDGPAERLPSERFPHPLSCNGRTLNTSNGE